MFYICLAKTRYISVLYGTNGTMVKMRYGTVKFGTVGKPAYVLFQLDRRETYRSDGRKLISQGLFKGA